MPLAFLHTFSMCSFHDSFESRMIPYNFVDFCTFISMPSTLRGLLNDQFLLLVNMTQWVLRWLSLSPLFLHHRLILFRLFCDTSLKVSASYPCLPLVCLGAVTINTSARSSVIPCRSLRILFLVYSRNSLTTRFHRERRENPSLRTASSDRYGPSLALQFYGCLPVVDHRSNPLVDLRGLAL